MRFSVFIVTMIFFLAAVFVYPSRRRRQSISIRQFYIWQKSCDFTIAACSFALITALVNTNLPLPGSVSIASSVVSYRTPTAEEILASLKFRDKSTLTRPEKRILKKEFKRQLKIYVVEKIKGNKDGSGKALWIALTIIGAVGLLYLVAALACSRSCNGSDFSAFVVGIHGVAAVVWGTIVLINRISRGRKKDDNPEK